MQITDEQIAQVESFYLALDEDEELDMEAAIAAFQTPGQLHLFAHNWNWGSGVEPLMSIIRHPMCDAGTALYIFWLTDPVHFFEKYGSREEVSQYEQPFYDLVVEIRDKFKAGFYKTDHIYVDPKEDAVGRVKSDGLKQDIPARMYKPTDGQDIKNLMVDFGLS